MPPKPKFTREEIVASAVDLVSKKGIDYLTTRNLGEWMGSSARPIFTVFNSMDEVIREVRKAATEKFNSYIREIVNFTPAFKEAGVRMVRFAINEPKLFQLIFMTENHEPVNPGSFFGNSANTRISAHRLSVATTVLIRKNPRCFSSTCGLIHTVSARFVLLTCACSPKRTSRPASEPSSSR